MLNGAFKATTLFLICTFLGIASAAIFAYNSFSASTKNNLRALLPIPIILWAAISMTEAYSNQYITMNSPIKILLMLSMMSIMFSSLYEAKYFSDSPAPRAYAVFSLIGVSMCSAFSLPFIIMYVLGIYSLPEFLPTAIASLTFAINLACKSIDYLKSQTPSSTPEEDITQTQVNQEEHNDVS